MTTRTGIQGRSEQFGRVAMRWIAVALLALLALGATLDNVGAQPSPGSYQNGFTKACRDNGGTPKRVGSRIVKCTLGDGTTITCDFNVDPPSCTTVKAIVATHVNDLVVSTTGEIFVDVQAEPALPQTQATSARSSGATIVFATDDDRP